MERIAAPEDLLAAFLRARRGKRHRAEVAWFELGLEREIFGMRDQLPEGGRRPGPYREFRVHDPVERTISAAPFRDRVVHQALCHHLEPVFEAEFLPCPFACRRGRGTHRALRAASYWSRRRPYVLHADVAKFFAGIDHEVLKSLLRRRVEDPRVLSLCETIIDGAPAPPPRIQYFRGDHLFSPVERRVGLPVGNLTSQWFANLLLHELDQLLAGEMKQDSYIRYMDDMLLFGESPAELRIFLGIMAERLDLLRLRLNARKTIVAPVDAGFGFLGFRIYPTHRLLLRGGVRRARRHLKRLRRLRIQGEITDREFRRSLEAWVAHARHGDTYRLRAEIFRDLGVSWEAGPGP